MDTSPLVLSFQVATAATGVCTVVGVLMAVALTHPRVPFRHALEVLVTAPMVLPPTVLGYLLLVTLGRRSPLGALWEHVTGSPVVFTRTGAVLAASVGALPLVVTSARAALASVDPTLADAARTLGAGPVRVLFTVRLPLAVRGILAGVVLAFARSLGDFGATLMVGGNIPGRTRTASLALYDAVQAGHDTEARRILAVLTTLACVCLYTVTRLGAPRRGP